MPTAPATSAEKSPAAPSRATVDVSAPRGAHKSAHFSAPRGATPTRSAHRRAASVCVALLAVCVAMYVLRTHTASPNQWLLVVRDGKMVTAGVGVSHTAMPGEYAVRFPSTLNKVPFKAQQVTREKQGVEVSGFAIWVINRVDDGPFKAYKHLGGLTPEGLADANAHLADMAESIIRSQVAQLSIDEVITQREAIRDAVSSSMQDVVAGWGVWLETVEVTDVRVLSDRLFESLQTPFREQQRQASEEARTAAQQAIDAARVHAKEHIDKAKAESRAEVAVFDARQSLVAAQGRERLRQEEDSLARAQLQRDAALAAHSAEIEEAAAEREHTARLAQLQRQHAEEALRGKQEAALQHANLEAELRQLEERTSVELEALRQKMAVEAAMTDTNLRKAALDALVEVYGALPLQSMDVRHVSFDSSAAGASAAGGTGGAVGGLGALLPGFVAMTEGFGAGQSTQAQGQAGKPA